MTLLPEHRTYLERHAIAPAMIDAAGLYSVVAVEELPAGFEWYGAAAVPAIVFPWRSPTGREVLQLKPDAAVVVEGEDRPRKYLLARGAPSVLNTVVADGDVVFIVEGTKQALAAGSYAPDKTAVYGLMGCSQWMDDNLPIPDLHVVDGKPVVLCFDADLRSNINVWMAAEGLAAACMAEGATSVKFVLLPGGRDAGLDDILATRDEGRRQAYLGRLIDGAEKKLPKRPALRKQKLVAPGDDRVRIVVSDDQKYVIDRMTKVLVDRWSGTELFDHGGVISRRKAHIIEPLDRGAYLDTLQEVAVTVVETAFGDAYGWPHGNCVLAALSRAGRFAPLHRISRAPFIRPDGSICTTPGYDETTGTYLATDLMVDIPERPKPEDVEAAVEFLLTEWLGDMPFEAPADRANALALIITPIIRGLVDLVPMALLDGLQMGVGKNLLADCIAILATGEPLDPQPYSEDNEEIRKLITSLFRRSADLVAFDEAHEIGGNALARSITALTYTDRILGVSQTASFPNRVTWMALGNRIQIRGDIIRRVYRISLRPTGANPEDRNADTFRHPDLRQWTREHRTKLMSAVLTIIRAWYQAGRPPSSRGAAFGSFEQWGRMVGGILEHACIGDFLANMKEWRSEASFDLRGWRNHYKWLWFTVGEDEFFTNDVRKRLLADPEGSVAPPGYEDPTGRDFTLKLGQAYGRMRDRIIGDRYRLTSVGEDRLGRIKWSITRLDGNDGDDNAGVAGIPPSYTHTRKNEVVEEIYKEGGSGEIPPPPSTRSPRPRVVFDIETASADQLWSYGSGFVRLVGYQRDGEIATTTNPQEVIEAAREGATLVGHNAYGFDVVALVKYHGLDLATVDVVDTKILAAHHDPPPARMKPGEAERYYSLDGLGQRLLGAGKTGDLKALAAEFGDFDRIPVDDPRYVDYCRGDVAVAAGLLELYGPMDDYVTREHEVARLAAQIMLNGFRVDTDLLAQRIAAGEKKRAELLAGLDYLGLPKTTKDGKRECKNPLATEEGKQIVERAFSDLGVKLPRTAAGAPQTGNEVMGAIQVRYKGSAAAMLALAIQELNGIRTIYETIAAALVGDRVHPSISFRQATGRWSVTDPGLTVVGKRKGKFVEREIFLPEEGHVIIAADLAQIDARAVAVHAQDPAYIAMMAPGLDLHAEIAGMIWGDRSRREDAKAMTHGFAYGEGVQTVSDTAGVPFEAAHAFLEAMAEKFPLVVEWQKRVREQAEAGLLLDNGFGRPMRPDPRRYWTQGPGLVGQGCARDLMMEGLLRLPRETWPFLRGVIHDEVVLSVPVDIVDDVERVVLGAFSFEWAPAGAEIPVAIVAELGKRRGTSWGDIYRKEVR